MTTPLDDRGVPEGAGVQPYEVTPRELEAMLAGEDPFLLIDVREADELAIARLDGAAHIPLGDLPAAIATLDADEDTPIVLLCHLGQRSMSAAHFLMREGFVNARSLHGGIDLWSLAIDPSVPRY